MTLDELKQYTRLKGDEIFYEVELHRLDNLKKEKVTYYTSPSLSATPSGIPSSPTERLALVSIEYAEKIEAQMSECNRKLKECREKLKAIDDFIDSVEDSETRSMLRRHIKQRTSFNQIANEHFVSRNYVAKKIKSVCNSCRNDGYDD